MERSVDPALQPAPPAHPPEVTAAVLAWEQLPAQCQRELLTTLVRMLVKRLPAFPRAAPEVRSE